MGSFLAPLWFFLFLSYHGKGCHGDIVYDTDPPSRPAHLNALTKFSFGIIADIQYEQKEMYSHRYYADSVSKLKKCVKYFNEHRPAFLFSLGDVTDRRNHSNLETILQILNTSQSPVYHVLGDHDLKRKTDSGQVYVDLGMPSPRYVLHPPPEVTSQHRVAFVVLNTNEISTYNTDASPEVMAQAVWMMRSMKKRKMRNYHSYNAAMSGKQLHWLRATLQQLCEEGNDVILFGHHSVAPAFFETNLWNDDQVREIIANIPNYPNCVRAYFNGHTHVLRHDVIGTTHYVSVPGMVQSRNTSFGVVDVLEGLHGLLFRVVWWGRVGSLHLMRNGTVIVSPPEWVPLLQRDKDVLAFKLARSHKHKKETLTQPKDILVVAKTQQIQSHGDAQADDIHGRADTTLIILVFSMPFILCVIRKWVRTRQSK